MYQLDKKLTLLAMNGYGLKILRNDTGTFVRWVNPDRVEKTAILLPAAVTTLQKSLQSIALDDEFRVVEGVLHTYNAQPFAGICYLFAAGIALKTPQAEPLLQLWLGTPRDRDKDSRCLSLTRDQARQIIILLKGSLACYRSQDHETTPVFGL